MTPSNIRTTAILTLYIIFPNTVFPNSTLFHIIYFTQQLFQTTNTLIFNDLYFKCFFGIPFAILFVQEITG